MLGCHGGAFLRRMEKMAETCGKVEWGGGGAHPEVGNGGVPEEAEEGGGGGGSGVGRRGQWVAVLTLDEDVNWVSEAER